uniref:Pantoate kinase n=1 Tax=Thermofilum pendens TaxID=2269 RepID=A0A7C3SKQ2_THEPE
MARLCAEAWSPAGLSGLWEACLVPGDELRTGARGAGMALAKGVRARVCLREEPGVKTVMNGVEGDFVVAKTVATLLLERAGRETGLFVEQWVEVPVGGGLGTSGASALAVALATAEVLDLKVSYREVAQVAHVTDVRCGTGLGTVSGLAVGGAVIVEEPGAPGYDSVDRILFDPSLKVVVGFFGPIVKSQVLRSDGLSRVNALGRAALAELKREPTVEKFLEISRRFALKAGLTTGNVLRAFEALSKLPVLGYSQAQVGDTVFVVADRDVAVEAAQLLQNLGARVLLTEVSWEPARLL